jgi:hypothetical protein
MADVAASGRDAPQIESAREWGVRQAELAPHWSLARLREVAAAVGVLLEAPTRSKRGGEVQESSRGVAEAAPGEG